ncbi:MAG: class B sortase, partial [Firmicutes bacterium]|nr:class B sortase [Candidatus Colimorpha enterica]
YTLKGMYTYKIVAAFQTTSDFYYIKTSFTNGDTFAEWANEMIANSAYDAGVTFTSDDRMITLSTCTNLTDNGRLCVEAILTDVYEKDAMEQ